LLSVYRAFFLSAVLLSGPTQLRTPSFSPFLWKIPWDVLGGFSLLYTPFGFFSAWDFLQCRLVSPAPPQHSAAHVSSHCAPPPPGFFFLTAFRALAVASNGGSQPGSAFIFYPIFVRPPRPVCSRSDIVFFHVSDSWSQFTVGDPLYLFSFHRFPCWFRSRCPVSDPQSFLGFSRFPRPRAVTERAHV